ncbi:MAG TPA: 16S rRNA (guanine(966)-N(2))-methyltransferase RsmD [Pseudogracilibacillus sp.]|nr:16S rRNA (guanine(966)-N(2))-methyltransferase RsmD [Pseudogracilibacillus sp.]
MRVIAGKLKGRNLFTVPNKATRPTSDKIKEAVFHVMGPYFNGGEALDLFAGSGALGIEAISRGIERVTFIDRHRTAVQTIRKNLRNLQIESHASVYQNDAIRALEILHKRRKLFDLVLIDPPYDKKVYTKVLENIKKWKLVTSGGYLYIEHAPTSPFIYDKVYYEEIFRRNYSKEIAVTILKVAEGEIEEE